MRRFEWLMGVLIRSSFDLQNNLVNLTILAVCNYLSPAAYGPELDLGKLWMGVLVNGFALLGGGLLCPFSCLMSLNVTVIRCPALDNSCLWQVPGGRDSQARMAGAVGGQGWDHTPLHN